MIDVEGQEKPIDIPAPEELTQLPQTNTNDAIALANIIYSEGAGEKDDFKIMVGSTALNRLMANKPFEFGSSIPEVISKGYSAAQTQSPLFVEANTHSFKDQASENSWKRSYQIANGLLSGRIPKQKGQFYHTSKEIRHNMKHKSFNYDLTKTVGKMQTKNAVYHIMSYK